MKTQFPAGKYYIGDLLYVMHDAWHEICLDHDEHNGTLRELKDGRQFWFDNVSYADGASFCDLEGNEYCVSSGSIGIIASDDILYHPENHTDLGNDLVEFDESFEVFCDDGVFHFGDIVINTDDEDCYDEEYDQDDDGGTNPGVAPGMVWIN
jgi:hypothetical protein